MKAQLLLVVAAVGGLLLWVTRAKAKGVGFSLRISNAPPEATHWVGEFYSIEEGRYISPEPLSIEATWVCTYNPYDTTIRIRTLDMVHAVTVTDNWNLGPVHSSGKYMFDVSTGILHEL